MSFSAINKRFWYSLLCFTRNIVKFWFTRNIATWVLLFLGGMLNKKHIGSVGERVAADFLVRKGFSIVEMNYRKPWGEIDIIALKGGVYRFVEVKAVSRETLPDVSREIEGYRPEEQVHESKLRKIARTAEMYMSEKDADFQIDVVGVFLDFKGRIARCRLYENVL